MLRAAGCFGWLALAALAAGASDASRHFLVYQFSVALTYAIAILGLNLLMGFNGQISVAQGVFFAVGGYIIAIFMTRYGMHYLATLPIAVVDRVAARLAGRHSGAALAGAAARLHHVRARGRRCRRSRSSSNRLPRAQPASA